MDSDEKQILWHVLDILLEVEHDEDPAKLDYRAGEGEPFAPENSWDRADVEDGLRKLHEEFLRTHVTGPREHPGEPMSAEGMIASLLDRSPVALAERRAAEAIRRSVTLEEFPGLILRVVAALRAWGLGLSEPARWANGFWPELWQQVLAARAA